MGETASGHDIIIVGAGVGGYVAAIRAGTWGARVALVEQADIGGTCLNRGCIPTKTLIESATAFRSASAFCEPARDLAAMIARKNEVVTGLRKGVSMLLKKRNVDVIEGRATLLDARTVEVAAEGGEPQRLHARNVILATGSRPSSIPGLEPDGGCVFDSDTILDASDVGPRIVVVGGGILGCEFAYIYAALGYEVTVVEMLESIVPVFSADAAREVTRALKKLGVSIRTGTRIEGADVGDTVTLDLGGESLEAETVLVAVGRKPNVEDVGLDSLGGPGVLNEKGFVQADAVGRTKAPGLRAIGDVTGKVMLAHAASHQGLAAVADCLGKPVPPEGAVPWCAYTHPEVALVGMLEPAAAEAGKQVVVGKFPVMALGRARAAGDTAGYFKVVADAGTRRILGAEIVGPHATDLIHEAALAVKLEATLEDIEEMVHAHPTFAEGLMEAAGVALGTAIHI